MMSILELFLVMVLAIVFYQDVTSRVIHVVLLVILFLLGCAINFFSNDLSFYDMLYNIIFIVINIIGLTLYFSIKGKSLVNPIDTSIGLGDIVFFVAITPLFNLKPFVLFFVLGLLFSLLAYSTILFFKKIKTIPLAAYLALFLILNVVIKGMFKIETLY